MFKLKTQEELSKLSSDDFVKYLSEYQGWVESEKKKSNDSSGKKIGDLETELNNLKTVALKDLNEKLKAHGTELKKIQTSGAASKETFEGNMKKAFDDNKELFEKLALANQKRDKGAAPSISLNVKAVQTYGDIDSGEDFAQMRQGIIDSPVRKAGFVRALFPTIPLTTEYYEWVEQNFVARDAQTANPCEPITSLTKEQFQVSNMKTQTVKDIMDFCLKFVEDYTFMQSRINKLINQSIALKVDQQLLYGTGTGTETFSINFHSSEFDAANPACAIDASVEKASMVDLILGMQTQIEELGKQNFFMPNVVMLNKCDWFTKVESRKNADGDYIDEKVSIINGIPYIGGMMVVTSPLINQNQIFVFDSSMGEVLDRQTVEISISTENADNWEREFASIKGLVRINFWVPNEQKNAFMKCSDVDAGIAAINKV